MFFNQYPYINENDLNLDYILKRVRFISDRMDVLEEWKHEHEAEYQELKSYIDAINSGDLPAGMVAGLEKWYRDYGIELIGKLVKMVFFGLTDDGYFVAYIPEQWDDILFGTSGLDDFPVGVDYGHLTLTY